MKKKIFVQNLNVGSAIEYMGDILISWLRELDVDVYEYKAQDRFQGTLRDMWEYEPDLIILNEYFYRQAVAMLAYRTLRDCKVIFVPHVWNEINRTEKDKHEGLFEFLTIEATNRQSDFLFCLNYKPEDVPWLDLIKNKISNRYYATDPDIFKVTTPWQDRKMFFYIGNILPHKLSYEFLEKIIDTDLVIDCYGKKIDKTKHEYLAAFDAACNAGNIRYFNYVPQEDVPEIMNGYKYLVMPHYGYEPFNWVLKQCAHCGVIPLVTNDRNSTRYNGKWIDWLNGMYMGCERTDDFINNLKLLDDERPDHSGISEYVTYEIRRRFPYQEFKEEFQNKVRELLYG